MIDEKLREILRKTVAKGLEYDANDSIAQIKQAFADEGWASKPFLKHLTSTKGYEYLSGQEWYDRFEKELGKEYGEINGTNHQILSNLSHITRAHSAAKKAANL